MQYRIDATHCPLIGVQVSRSHGIFYCLVCAESAAVRASTMSACKLWLLLYVHPF